MREFGLTGNEVIIAGEMVKSGSFVKEVTKMELSGCGPIGEVCVIERTNDIEGDDGVFRKLKIPNELVEPSIGLDERGKSFNRKGGTDVKASEVVLHH